MGYDFQRSCHIIEKKKVVWVICLVLASSVMVQYFEIPVNRDGMLSLLSGSRVYFSSSDVGGEIKSEERRESALRNDSSLSSTPKIDRSSISYPENVMLEHNTDELEMKDRSISIAPEMASIDSKNFDISPSVAYLGEEISPSILESSAKFAASPVNLEFPRAPTKTYDKVSADTVASDISPSAEIQQDITALLTPETARIPAGSPSFDFSLAPTVSSLSIPVSPENMSLNVGAPTVACCSPPTSHANDSMASNSSKGGIHETRNDDRAASSGKSPSNLNTHSPEKKPESPVSSVVTISEMYDRLVSSRASSLSKSPLWPSAAEQELLEMRFQIEHGTVLGDHPRLYAPIYRNLSRFLRSYELMEKKLKVYIYDYKDVKTPVFHNARQKGIYASEGWFMKLLESSAQYTTQNPEEAHLFYLPFSSQLLAHYLYIRNSHSFDQILGYLKNYVDTIKTRYPFWNRTDGADHFLVACHDWAPYETKRLMPSCIRALCNSDVKEGFQFGKDVSLPETYIQSPENPSKEIGGQPPSKRKILAFFAGQMHGFVRPILLKHWENKDPNMKIVGKMRKGYAWHMKNSKYCICAKGYEVNSPRVVEAIMYECVPVIISDNFVPPFFEILNWETFAVFILEKDIPNLKNILLSISERRYAVMHGRVKEVRQHFLWHNKPVKYDVFHMILHSIWYNRVFIRRGVVLKK